MVECGERGSLRQAAAAAPPEHVLSPSAFCLIIFCPLPTPCSQLWRDGEPVEVQQMPHRLVLWCTMPEGAAQSVQVLWAGLAIMFPWRRFQRHHRWLAVPAGVLAVPPPSVPAQRVCRRG